MRRILSISEQMFVVGGMLLMMNAVVPLVTTGGDASIIDPESGDRVYQTLAAAVYFLSGLLILPRIGRVPTAIRRSAPVIMLAVLALLSVFWAQDPLIAFRRAAALLGSTTFAIYLAVRYDPPQLLRLTAWAMISAIALSFAFALFVPELAIHAGDKHEGMWRGVFQQKNLLARWMALAIAVFLAYRRYSRYPTVIWAWFGLAWLLIWLSQSMTGVIAGVIMIMMVPIVRLLRVNALVAAASMLALAIGAIIFAVLLIPHTDSALAAVGKDATLTGRTLLWHTVIERGMDHWLLGHGYRSFWLGLGSVAESIWYAVGWSPATGHNSFIDVFLELGIIGLGMFLYSLVVCARRVVVRIRVDRDTLGLWYASFVVFVLVFSVTHTVIPAQNNLIWVWYLIVFIHTFGWQIENRAPSRYPSGIVLAERHSS